MARGKQRACGQWPIATGIVSVVQLFFVGSAGARTDFAVDGSATTGIATDPFSIGGLNTQSALATIAVAPEITITEAKGNVRVAGRLARTAYARRYGPSDDFGASVAGNWRLSRVVKFGVSGSFTSAIVGTSALDLVGQSAGAIGGAQIDGVALIGSRTRQTRYDVSTTVTYSPNSRERLTVTPFASATRLSGASAGRDYADYGASVTYDNQLTSRIQAATSLHLSRFECRGARPCSATTVRSDAGGSIQFDAFWSLAARAGLSLTRSNENGQTRSRASFAGSADLCRKDSRRSYCLSVTRSDEPSVLGGVRTFEAIVAHSSFMLSPRNTLRIEASQSRVLARDIGIGETIDQSRVRVGFEKQFTRKLRASFDTGYLASSGTTFGRRSNFDLGLTLSYRFGARA